MGVCIQLQSQLIGQVISPYCLFVGLTLSYTTVRFMFASGKLVAIVISVSVIHNSLAKRKFLMSKRTYAYGTVSDDQLVSSL